MGYAAGGAGVTVQDATRAEEVRQVRTSSHNPCRGRDLWFFFTIVGFCDRTGAEFGASILMWFAT